MKIHIWYNDGWYWDDAEDHGGYDRNTPCGPFNARRLAIADAEEVATIEEIIEGKPTRYSE